jgi:lipopolysaccharide biosynthesis regulator YciM
MLDLIWLLLPVAAASGWVAAKNSSRKKSQNRGSLSFLSERYIRGLNYLLNEQQDKALEFFVEMVEVDSETVETHLVLGSLFRRRGEVDRAIRIHQNLIARPNLERPHKIQALLELGKDYMKAGLLDRAEGVFNELISLGSESSEPYSLLRDIYVQESEWERAIETSRQFERFSKESQDIMISQFYCELAEKDLKQGAVTQAINYAKKAASLDKNNVRTSLILADCACENQDFKKAIQNLSLVMQQDAKFFPVILPVVKDCFHQLGRQEDMAKFLMRAEQNYDSPSLIRAQTDFLIQANKLSDAREILDEIFSEKKFTPELIQSYASLLSLDHTDSLPEPLFKVIDTMAELGQDEFSYRCKQCGFEAMSLFWQCPSCHGWNTVYPIDEWMKLHREQQ